MYFIRHIGHRLERDVETGGLQTRQTRKQQQIQKGCEERGLECNSVNIIVTPTSSEMPTPTTPSGGNSHCMRTN